MHFGGSPKVFFKNCIIQLFMSFNWVPQTSMSKCFSQSHTVIFSCECDWNGHTVELCLVIFKCRLVLSFIKGRMWYICDTFVLHKNTGSVIKVPWMQGMFSSRHETSWHAVFLGRFCYCWLLIIHPQCLVRAENSPAHSHMWITLLFGVTALWGGRPSMAPGIGLKGLTKKRPVLQQWHKCSCIIVMLKLNKEQALRLLAVRPQTPFRQWVTKCH